MKSAAVLFFSIILAFSAFSQSDSLMYSNMEISILTCGQGDQLYSTFGHTAIRIQNVPRNKDYVFNYGVFNSFQDGFYLKFLRGKLPYYLGVSETNRFLLSYKNELRSVTEQKLSLNLSQKKELMEFLSNNALEENRNYRYDFFYDNCATRVVDAFNGEIQNLEYNGPVTDKTFRELLHDNLKSMPWTKFGIDLVIGSNADKNAMLRGQLFLPEYVQLYFANTTVDGKPIVKQTKELLTFEKEDSLRRSAAFPWAAVLGSVLLILFLFSSMRKSKFHNLLTNVIITIGFLASLLLAFMWFGTEHVATNKNYNLLWLSPLLVLLFIKQEKFRMFAGYTLVVGLLLSLLNTFYQFLPQNFNPAFAGYIGLVLAAVLEKMGMGDILKLQRKKPISS